MTNRLNRPLLAVFGLLMLVFASPMTAQEPSASSAPSENGTEIATFGSGCFWCTESDFDKVPGVLKTTSGYTGGTTQNPTYKQVGTGRTGHTEVLLVEFDPKRVTYKQLLDHYWRNVDLLDGKGQFCDRGNQYRPAIFTHSDEQKRLAENSKAEIDKSGKFKSPVAVEILPATKFTAAEDYHQDYYLKNPLQYRYYRYGCGRDARLEQLWGPPETH